MLEQLGAVGRAHIEVLSEAAGATAMAAEAAEDVTREDASLRLAVVAARYGLLAHLVSSASRRVIVIPTAAVSGATAAGAQDGAAVAVTVKGKAPLLAPTVMVGAPLAVAKGVASASATAKGRAVPDPATVKGASMAGAAPQTLHEAAQQGDADTVAFFLDRGAKIDELNVDGRTALYIASKEGHTSIVELLLNRGARIDATMARGSTALHIATSKGHTAIVELLLNRGVNVKHGYGRRNNPFKYCH